MYFPAADIEVSLWAPPLAAFCISLVTSTGGVSGAFLLLPFQMSVLGFTGPAVSPTNHLYNVLATPSGIWRFAREGRMLWPVTWVIALGALPGVLIGAWIRIEHLHEAEDFQVFVGLVLLYLGGQLAIDLMKQAHAVGSEQARAERDFHKSVASGKLHAQLPQALRVEASARWIEYEFGGEQFKLPVPQLFALCLAVGVVGGIYGIGGGAFIAPFLITVFGMPVYLAAGAALMGTFLTSSAGVLFYCALAPLFPHMAIAPDWMLGFLFGMGGIAGMYCGAMLQKFLPARWVKAILAVCILLPSLAYLRASFRRL